jgi:hypothetical protein
MDTSASDAAIDPATPRRVASRKAGRVLLALGNERAPIRSLREAHRFAEALGAELHVIRVVPATSQPVSPPSMAWRGLCARLNGSSRRPAIPESSATDATGTSSHFSAEHHRRRHRGRTEFGVGSAERKPSAGATLPSSPSGSSPWLSSSKPSGRCPPERPRCPPAAGGRTAARPQRRRAPGLPDQRANPCGHATTCRPAAPRPRGSRAGAGAGARVHPASREGELGRLRIPAPLRGADGGALRGAAPARCIRREPARRVR